MGEAKQRRDAKGVIDERTDSERADTLQLELRRIHAQKGKLAAMKRMRCLLYAWMGIDAEQFYFDE